MWVSGLKCICMVIAGQDSRDSDQFHAPGTKGGWSCVAAPPQTGDWSIMTKGIVYVALGGKYIEYAMRSAATALRVSPGLPTALFTNDPDMLPKLNPFTKVRELKLAVRRPGARKTAKMMALAGSPFEDTIFLDADTRVIRSIDHLFALLDTSDIAMSYSARRVNAHAPYMIPDWFPEYSSGVIVYRRNAVTARLFQLWRDLHAEYLDKYGIASDQVPLRKVLYDHAKEFSVHVLPNEYNCYVEKPVTVGGKVYILHGRSENIINAESFVLGSGIRSYVPVEKR